MFVGHYSASLAAKAGRRSIPLWVLFIAVQFMDVCWAILVLAGIEKLRIVPGITKTNPMDLYYMPYTHSLDGALVLSALAGIAYWLWRKRDGFVIAAAVFSHWVLDFIVHRPDLPLYDDSAKVGLGLWNYPAPAFALELALLFGAMWLYLKAARYSMIVFGILMACVQAYVFSGSPPASDRAAAMTALASYVIFAAVAAWLDRSSA